ncbi:MAG TPA: hypothetical protein VJ957_11105 [Longimicrobiales bacterium]|nr:hypothetical protein [Longimicrobiales bacterium]
MSTSTTAAQHPEPEAPHGSPTPPVRRPVRRRIDPDRALGIGIVVSVLLHALLFVLFSRVFLVPTPALSPGRLPPQRTRLPGMQVLNITPTQNAPTVPQAAPQRQPIPKPEAQPRPQARPPQQAAPPRSAEGRPPLSPAERLRPTMGDARLWAPVQVPAAGEEAPNIEDVKARIAARLQLLNDSALAAAEAAAKATDWTFTDKNGEKWGITPGKLHLGKITLPLPLALPPPTGDAGKREADWAAIRDQAAREAARENFKDRVKAIRARKEKEHEEKLKKEKEQKQNPPKPPPGGTPPP